MAFYLGELVHRYHADHAFVNGSIYILLGFITVSVVFGRLYTGMVSAAGLQLCLLFDPRADTARHARAALDYRHLCRFYHRPRCMAATLDFGRCDRGVYRHARLHE